MHNVAQRWDGLSICDIPCGTLVVNVASLACGQVCELSGDHWHHADESDYLKVSEGRDGTYAVRAKCKYCHKEFIATGLTADNLSTAYSDYVNTLPAQGYDSAGTLLWQPRWIEDTVTSSAYLTVTRAYSGDKDRLSLFKFNDNTVVSEIDLDDPVYSYSISGSKVIVQVGTRSEFYLAFRNSSSHYFCAPITGKYTCLSSSYSYFSKYVSASETICQGRSQWEYANYSKYVDAGSAVGISSYSTSVGSSWGIRGTFELYTPLYSIEPFDENGTIANNFLISTRVNNFNGDYYDSVTNNYYNNTTIVNETTNNYYDMTTNNNYTMSNWSYDYASRTYFITLEDGTTVTVQFGDDCMTITKNDVTNSYQYVIKNNSTPDTPTGCKHDWQETIDTAPTCLEGGHASYTCSLCGETYEQNLAAKGHDWKVKEHVNTVYNADGTVEIQGHTLYECSVCGEQWYTDTGAPPPDVSGSSNILAWLQAFQTWLDEKLDSLFSAADAVIVTKLDALIEKSSDTIVNVIEDDTYIPNVFYLDENNGAVDTTKDGVSLFADLVRWLWKNVFDGAFDAADITKLDGLFYDPAAVAEEVPDGS